MRDLPPTPQAKFRMTELARNVVAELSGEKPLPDRDRSPEEVRAEAMTRLDEIHARRFEPIKLSDEAKRLLEGVDEFAREALR